jgi:ABC-2 type transport system permease protein
VIRLIHVELLKLRTTRLTYGLLGAAIALTALFAALEASRAGSPAVAPLSTAAGLDAVITGGVWALLFAAVLGVTVSSGEFRHATITATYLVSPRRDRVLTAKCMAAACAGAVFGLAGWVIATGIGLGIATADGYQIAIGDATLARYAAGHVLAAALLAAIGAGLGALVRSQLGAIIGLFGWAVVIESLVGGLYHSVQPYLPYTAATTLSGSSLGGAAFGPAHGADSTAAPLPFAAATALLAAIALALAAIAARTTVEKDVS